MSNILYFLFFGWVDEFSRGNYLFGFILLLITLLVLSLLCVICLMVYDAIDTSGPKKRARGTVTETNYVPAHTTMVKSGNVMVPIHHPARWYATFSVPEGAEEEIAIDQNVYDHLQKGDQMDVMTTIGRLSGHIRVVSLAH
jgi:hypothetical protein